MTQAPDRETKTKGRLDSPSMAYALPSDKRGWTARAVQRPVATFMFACIASIVGAVGLSRLPVDLLPAFELPSVTVFAPYPGVGSLEVESLVLEPLEEAVASVPGLRTLRSTAREGAAVVYLSFAYGTNLLEALNDVRVAVERSRSRLPEDLEAPSVFRFDPNQFPILFLSVSGESDFREISRIARDEIKPRLSRVPGVAAIEERGLFQRELRLELLAGRLTDLGIPIEQVENAIRAENLDVSAGKVLDGGREVGLRTVNAKSTPEALAGIPVATRQGRVIYLREVTRLVDGTAEVDNIVRVNGQVGVRLGVRKGPNENTIEVAQQVRMAIADMAKDYPEVSIQLLMDQSAFIERAVDGATQAALIGGILAIAVLLLFLKSFRATLLVAITIPISVLVTFAVMDRVGISLNLMSIGGIALGIGMLVDNSVVVLESIVHQVESGLRGREAAARGAGQVALAVAASTATTVVIFVPVLFLEGINRVIYGQLALVVTASLLASLIVALTVVPAFAGRFFRDGKLRSEKGPVFLRVEAAYVHVLDGAMNHPRSALGILLGVALSSLGFVSSVETELMPTPDEGRIEINLTLPVGTPLEETDVLTREIVRRTRQVAPEAETIFATVGAPGWWSNRTSETARVSVRLPELESRIRETAEVTRLLREAMPKSPGATIGVRPGGGFFLLNFLRGGGGEDRLEVQVRGVDFGAMQKYAAEVAELMREVPGVVDVREPKLQGRDEIVVRVQPERAGQLGIRAEGLGRSLETYVRGRRVSRLRTAEEEIPIVVRLAEEDRQHLAQIRALLVHSPVQGEVVPVSEVASISIEEGPLVISREEGARVLQIGAEVEGVPLGEVSDALRKRLQESHPPPGVRAVLAGEAASSDSLFYALALGALLAVCLVYMVMAAQFESLLQPLWVMGSVPFAAVGVLILFGLGGTTLNLYSFMGMIVLIGISVNNAIVLVDYTHQLRSQEGFAVREALRLACQRRLRPILMTTATTLLGLLPVALSSAEGAELQGPLARVVVSGLFFSTVVSLVLIPVIYGWVEGYREQRKVPEALTTTET